MQTIYYSEAKRIFENLKKYCIEVLERKISNSGDVQSTKDRIEEINRYINKYTALGKNWREVSQLITKIDKE